MWLDLFDGIHFSNGFEAFRKRTFKCVISRPYSTSKCAGFCTGTSRSTEGASLALSRFRRQLSDMSSDLAAAAAAAAVCLEKSTRWH